MARTFARLALAGIVSLVILVASAEASPILYATGEGGLGSGSALYVVNPQTGASTLLWELSFAGSVSSGGLAYDAGADTLFATGYLNSSPGISRLFTIDRFTGATTAIGGMDPSLNLTFGGLAIDPVTQTMYATGTNGTPGSQLYTINKTTGAATLVGSSSDPSLPSSYGCPCLFGLGFRNDGTLFANGYAQPLVQESNLFTVDLGTGHATDLGSNGVSFSRQLNYSGLAFRDDGVLLSLGSAAGGTAGLYSVNTATGVAALLGGTGVNFGVDGGLAFAPDRPSTGSAVPEPGTLVLVAGGVGAVLRRRLSASSRR